MCFADHFRKRHFYLINEILDMIKREVRVIKRIDKLIEVHYIYSPTLTST
jgi:hypothetical protein